jgi:hypothetical protein
VKVEEQKDGYAAAPTTRATAPSPKKKIDEIDIATLGIDGARTASAETTRTRTSMAAIPRPPPLQFLKPAGVDDPSGDVARRDGSRPTQLEAAGIDSNDNDNDSSSTKTNGRTRTRRQNLKRERDDRHEGDPGAPTADTKRKKSGAAAMATATAAAAAAAAAV